MNKKYLTLAIILLLSYLALNAIDTNYWQRITAPALAAEQVKSSNAPVIKLRLYNTFSQKVIPLIGISSLIVFAFSFKSNKKTL